MSRSTSVVALPVVPATEPEATCFEGAAFTLNSFNRVVGMQGDRASICSTYLNGLDDSKRLCGISGRLILPSDMVVLVRSGDRFCFVLRGQQIPPHLLELSSKQRPVAYSDKFSAGEKAEWRDAFMEWVSNGAPPPLFPHKPSAPPPSSQPAKPRKHRDRPVKRKPRLLPISVG